MKRFFAALSFLTILPAGKMADTESLGRAVPFFPVVGILIGMILGVLDLGLRRVGIPPFPEAIVMVMAWAMLTGGLHLDGVADSADGLCSARSRERMLEIMRDSRIGTMGALALIFVITLKSGCLLEIPKAPTPLLRILLLAPVAGRCLQVSMLTWLPYARRDGGIVQVFLNQRRQHHAIIALILLIVLSGGLLGVSGVVYAGVSLSVGLIFSIHCLKKLGGFTGDTLGSICEMGEVAFLFAAASFPAGGMGS